MLNLNLSNEETKVLADVIECCISELRGEIVHTDNWEFKAELKQRKEMLRSLLIRMNQQIPVTVNN
ncbi:MAG: hypothetical protein EHM41_14845 [Chloroflexi bacterium]|nr:MAG: hypothetical protein EHM41_14845 [Chloroflexota bacterium]